MDLTFGWSSGERLVGVQRCSAPLDRRLLQATWTFDDQGVSAGQRDRRWRRVMLSSPNRVLKIG